MPVPSDDWRRTSGGLPEGTAFRWRDYAAPRPDWDHDHCVFCLAKFIPRSEQGKDWVEQSTDTIYFDGYATVEPSGSGFDWVCRPCFDDFADEFNFAVVGDGRPIPVADGTRSEGKPDDSRSSFCFR